MSSSIKAGDMVWFTSAAQRPPPIAVVLEKKKHLSPFRGEEFMVLLEWLDGPPKMEPRVAGGGWSWENKNPQIGKWYECGNWFKIIS